jgi:putative exosortase-associated protein (TIGR04073 family)
MKKISAAIGVLVLLLSSSAFGEEKKSSEENRQPVAPGIEMAEKSDATVFFINRQSEDDGKISPIQYLTRYYAEGRNFREVIISCFLSMAAAFPSDEYNAASHQVLEIYDAFIASGVSEEFLYISVRFEKNSEPAGLITVEFLRHAGYFERVGRNFVTGITDIVSSPMELPMGMVSESQKSGVVTGVPKGVFSGFGQALRKAGTGTIKLLTFWAG